MTTNRMGLEQEGRLSEKKKYPSEQYLNEILINLDFAANIPIEAVRVMARELLAYRRASKEPVAWYVGGVLCHTKEEADLFVGTPEPLYESPPIQAVTVPDEIEPDYDVIKRILPTSNPDEYACCIGADMWNACRAAMLKSVTNEL